MNATAEKVANLGPRQIELKKVADSYGTKRGEREVFVDGQLWARIYADSHGMHGYSYQIMQVDAAGNGDGFLQRKLEHLRGDKWTNISFRPEKPDKYDRVHRGAKAAPIDAQLRGWVAGLIAEGKLRNPTDVTASNKAAAEKYRRECDARDAAEAAEFEAKARECLNVVGDDVLNEHLGDNVTAEIISRIVAAMKWAQTK